MSITLLFNWVPCCKLVRRGTAGFTLLELLVVLVILGLLAALAGPQIVGYLGGARSETARLQIDGFGTALNLFWLDVGEYPSTEQGLQALIEAPDGVERWNGPYLASGALPVDPWGNAYVYRSPGEETAYELVSLGADGRPGGEDEDRDISTAP